MKVSDAWEQHAEKWIGWASESTFDGFFSGTWPTLRDVLPEPRGVTVDLGCGEGRAGRELVKLGHDVVGIDLAPTLLRAAAAQEPTFPVVRGDMTQVPLPDGVTALVVASCSLHDVDDLQGAIAEIGRILKPGGVLCAAMRIRRPPSPTSRRAATSSKTRAAATP
jgi:SAM-dependent methyltransferase